MSLGFQLAVKRRPNLWNSLTEEEKREIQQWCPISDMLIQAKFQGQDVDAVVALLEKTNEKMLTDLFKAVIARHRRRKKIQNGELSEEEAAKDYDEYEEEKVMRNDDTGEERPVAVEEEQKAA